MKQIKEPSDEDLRHAFAGVKLAWLRSVKYYFSMIDGHHYLTIVPMDDINTAPKEMLDWWASIK